MKAAEQGNAEAMFEVGVCYFHGTGTAEGADVVGKSCEAGEQRGKNVP